MLTADAANPQGSLRAAIDNGLLEDRLTRRPDYLTVLTLALVRLRCYPVPHAMGRSGLAVCAECVCVLAVADSGDCCLLSRLGPGAAQLGVLHA